jgi:hypothetical protein
MKPSHLAFAVLVPLALAACGVPDLVAHGVKTYEKSQQPRSQAEPAVAQPVQPQPMAQPARYEAEAQNDPVQAVPQRESVTTEPLR